MPDYTGLRGPDYVALTLANRVSATAPSTTPTWATVKASVTTVYRTADSFDGTRYYLTHGIDTTGNTTAQVTIVSADGTTVTGPGSPNLRQLARGAWLNGKHYVYGGCNAGAGTIFGILEAYTPGGANGAAGSWQTLSSSIGATYNHDMLAANGYLWLLGGNQNTAGSAVARLGRYTPGTDTWTTMSPMPAARYNGNAFVIGNKIYYAGGNDINQSLVTTTYVYDMTADTWASTGSLPTTNGGAGQVAVVAGKAYLSNGTTSVMIFDPATGVWTSGSQFGTQAGSHVYSGTFVSTSGTTITSFAANSSPTIMETLDLTGLLDTSPPPWTTLAALAGSYSGAAVSTDGTRIYVSQGTLNGGVTTSGATVSTAGVVSALPASAAARYLVAGAWANGRHYAIGGDTGSGSLVGTTEAYSPAGANGNTGTWTQVSGLPQTLSQVSAVGVGTFVYAAGGRSGPSAASQALYRYDTTANTWTALANMPAARWGGAFVALGTKLYYLSGVQASGTPAYDIYIYDTVAGIWTTAATTWAVNGALGTAAVIGGLIYGFDGSTVVGVYDPATGVSKVNQPAVTAHGTYPGSVAIGDRLYLISGSITANVDVLTATALSPYARRLRVLWQYLSAVGMPLAATAARRIPTVAPVLGWSTLTTAGEAYARSQACVSTDGTRIYVTNGYNSSVGALPTGFTVATNGTVTVLPSSSGAKLAAAGAWCNGRHWSIAGTDANGGQLNRVDAYTPAGANGASGTWTTYAVLPSGSAFAGAAAVIGNFIYYAGGASQSNYTTGTALVYRYDTVANTWSAMASMPAARTVGAMVAVAGKLYFLGGYSTGNAQTATVFVYDPAANTWSTSAGSLAVAYSAGWATAIGTVIYYGVTGSTTVRTFDTVSLVAGTTPDVLPVAHNDITSSVLIGTTLYVLTGQNTQNVDRIDYGAASSFAATVRNTRALAAIGI